MLAVVVVEHILLERIVRAAQALVELVKERQVMLAGLLLQAQALAVAVVQILRLAVMVVTVLLLLVTHLVIQI
jgi:hypothetical protein